MIQDPDFRIIEIGLILPPAPRPAGIYKPLLVVDKFFYISGHGPVNSDGTIITGRLGAEFDKQSAMINRFRDLKAEVFGEDNGIGDCSALGMILHSDIPV